MNFIKAMDMGRLLCLHECHLRDAVAHLLTGDEGGENVHLLLLAAKHLDRLVLIMSQ